MAAMNIGGLASGLDTNGIIDGLTQIEQTKVTREENKKKALEDKQQAYSDLFSRIGSFVTKVDALNDPAKFNLFKATSDSTDNVTATGSAEATPGTYEIEVQKLATSQKIASGSYAAVNTVLGITGSFSISKTIQAVKNDPSKTTSTVNILASDTLKDVAAKINASDSGVTASLLTVAEGDNRLVLTSKDPGSQAFTLKNLTGNALGAMSLTDDVQKIRTDFNFLKQEGGAASLSNTFGDLALSIGSKPITDGDQINFTGTDASGNAVSGSLAINMTGPTPTTLQDLVNQVKASFGGPGAVDVELNKSGEIVVTDKTSGATAMTLSMSFADSDTSGSKLSLGASKSVNNFSNILNEGSRSFYKVDNMAVSSQTNSDDKVAKGTTFNLYKAEIGKVVKVSLDRDWEGIKGNVKNFVDEYNSLMKFIKEKTKVDMSSAPTADPTNPSAGKSIVKSKGPLAGESEVGRLRASIQKIVTDPVNELAAKTQYISLSRIGVVTDATTGELTVKEDNLKKALETDFEGVKKLFGPSGWSDNPSHSLGRFTKDTETGTYAVDTTADTMGTTTTNGVATPASVQRIGTIMISNSGTAKGLSITAPAGSGSGNFTFVRGVSSKLKTFYDQANDYVKGSFKTTRETMDRMIKDQDKRVTDLQDRTDRYKAALTSQFSSLEQSVSRLKSQSAAFSSQISSLR